MTTAISTSPLLRNTFTLTSCSWQTTARCARLHYPSSAGSSFPGAYRGLVEKIPYLKDLGMTAVELMPVQEFNECQLGRVDPRRGRGSGTIGATIPYAFFAPKTS